jgi:hypothetical protein
VRENLTQKGPSIDPAASPSSQENEIKLLREEIRALHWLARRKEQEWDNVIRLLKQKEERLMRSERQYSLGAGDLTLYRASQSLCDLASKSLVRNSLNEKSVAEMNTQQHLSTGKIVLYTHLSVYSHHLNTKHLKSEHFFVQISNGTYHVIRSSF